MNHAGLNRGQMLSAGRHVSSTSATGWVLRPVAVFVAAILGLGLVTVLAAPSQAADPCATGNAIACENSKPGSPSSEWDITGDGDDTIEGFATDMSVNVGGTVSFKIHAEANYTMDIYRMGYYGGDGARKITSLTPNQTVSKANQPSKCVNNSSSTGLIDCGTWGVSASWAVPSTAVSGIYFAHIIRNDNGADNHVMFVVRNDAGHSDMIYQTSDTTWQAYNNWGGNSLYGGEPVGRAYKVSYNRPFNTRGTPGGRDFVWANEYPMVRFLESQGYDVAYQSGLDTDRAGSLLLNHKIFMSVGHDEYWSGQQRKNVEAARDAGVSLAFFSGNEVYWKTRYENSVDGANTPYRTLVTYKETADNTREDPLDLSNNVWTGTWRDPRFSPPTDGGRPENSLTGTIFTVNSGTQAIKVPAADGKMRFWRNTAVGSQSAGATYTLPMNTLGYEWDEDLDNGSRPAGLIDLSTANYDVPQKLIDYGSVVAPGNATHHLTLYRAGSGALVFGAGTVQWTWGLDSHHDGDTTATDQSMRQATVNLFADMGAQPTTLTSDLVAATKSPDTTAPTSVVTSPASGATLANGSTITVTGTASDVGGQVGGVEVSMDAGQTWHPATGRGSWSYTGIVVGTGASSIRVRATDDSANVQSGPTQVPVTVSCPCTLFKGQTPTSPSDTDTSEIELGTRFTSAIDGYVTGITFYKGTNNTGTHTGTLWSNTGTQLATGTFSAETATGWQSMSFANPVHITAGTTYVASYHAPKGGYATTSSFFDGVDSTQAPLTAARSTTAAPNGVYDTGSTRFPASTFKGGNYWVSPIFNTVQPPDTTAPVVTAVTPSNGSSSVPVAIRPTVTFSEPIKAGTLSIQLSSPAGLVAGTTAFDSGRQVATFTPSAPLANVTTYTVSTTGGTDDAGNALSAASSTTFRTSAASTPGVCPCSIWPDSEVPAIVSVNDPSQVELGVKFQADQNGYIDGIRFYKGASNIGTHTGTLWTSTGTQLATATFTGESSSGWQQVLFASKVAVTAGTTYVASYNTGGYYSATAGQLNSAVVNSPLTALASGTDGPNGVYNYGTHSFPGNSAGGTSYGVDVVFEGNVDTTPPAVTGTKPGNNATSVRTDALPAATFSEKVASGLTATLKTGSTTVASTVALDTATGRTATITPSAALTAGTTYTVSLSGGKDATGNTMTAYSWSFTTSGAGACPCGIYPSDYVPALTDSGDPSALELGVRFTPNANGYITGVRFYKGAGNTGSHVGSLWSTGGSLISSATFSNESATGWQQVTFAAPVAVSAGTSYIATYSDPNGHYAADVNQLATAWVNGPLTAPADASGASNGVYATTPGRFPTNTYQSSSYGVDVVFTTGSATDTVPPSLISTNPVDGATSVPLNLAPVATFNEAIAAGSVTGTLTGPGSTVVSSTVTVGADKTVTVTPSTALANNTKYTVKITGSDLAGNAMTSPVTFSYTTAKAVTTACPCSLWSDESTPAVASDSDTRSIEVGVNFSASSNGFVNGIRFYKGPDNTGTHVGTLWSSTGTELAKATFTGESSAGWQEVAFASPVAVTAGTTYVASYHADNGGFASTEGGLANVAVSRGPLTAPFGTATAPNGVYVYGARAFPTSGSTTNYWVDVVFDTTAVTPPATDTTPPTVGTLAPASAATGVAATSTVSGVFSEPVSSASVQFTVKDGSTAIAGATAYDATTRKATFTPTASLPAGRTLTASLQGTDTAGNAMTAPTTWQFTVQAAADTTAPTVTAVSATGSGSTATVTWTTNEASSSVVSYGTSATSLTATATATGTVTAHSVGLTGLTGNTRYYYRVTSVDAAGNSATSPATTAAAAQYAPSVAPISQSSTADFTAGTVSGAYVSPRATGDVVLAPTATTEFTGTAVPSTWSSTSLASGSSVTVSGGTATVSGRLFRSTATYTSSRQISAVATFKAVNGQWLGATDGGFTGALTHWAAFRTTTTGGLVAETDNGLFGTTTTNLSGTLIGSSHTFEVDWTSSATVFKVDGATVATQNRGISNSMYAAAQDGTVDANPLLVKSVWVTPYAATGTFTSSVVDAGATVAWGTLTPTATIPTGTTITYQVRTGPSATAGGTGWSAYTTVAAGAKIPGTQRYLQYKVTLTTNSTRNTTPTLSAVQLGYTIP